MNHLRTDLIVAFREGNFLQVVYDKSLREEENRNVLVVELVSIHNDGLIDVIAGFKDLENKPDAGYDFFLTRHILEEVLPRLNAPIRPVMDCVIQLVKEAGQDMVAGDLFASYIDFCAAEPSRPKDSLKQIEVSIDQLADLLSPTIIAGTRIDTEHYLNEAIRFTGHENIDIRKRAIFSLGKIQFPQDSVFIEPTLACLELSVGKETDDQLLGSLIKSAFSLYRHDKSKLSRVTDLIVRALSKGGDYALHAASELFGFNFNELPDVLLDALLDHLRRVRPQHKGTLDNIDYGLVKLLKQKNPMKGIEFLETYLLSNHADTSLDIFDSVILEIYKNNNLLNKLLTRWFLRGDRVLCEGIQTVVNKANNSNIVLEMDQSELVSSDLKYILYIARKTIGYLFFKPVTAASIIISLMRHTSDDETLQQLSTFLFEPLLINFPGKVKDYLIRQAESESVKTKTAIETALKVFNDYLDDLKSTGVIPALHPPQTQRDAYRRHFSMLMSESLKEAEKKSVFLSFISKSVLLYGRKSIDYVYGPDGQSNRMETPLQSHGTEIEFPRLENIDPFGLDYMLRVFRVEQLKK